MIVDKWGGGRGLWGLKAAEKVRRFHVGSNIIVETDMSVATQCSYGIEKRARNLLA